MEVTKFFYKNSDKKPSAYKIHNILDLFTCNTIERYYENFGLKLEDPRMQDVSYKNGSHTYGDGNDIFGISLLESITPIVSNILGNEVLPSYSYTRVYEKGTRLFSHRDRQSCEISMSITLANYPNSTKQENFYISKNKDESDPLKLSIGTGDGLMFFGSSYSDGFYHWRDETDSDYMMQIFLHWVYKNGKFKDHAYEWTK
jgi:hypothetical protein